MKKSFTFFTLIFFLAMSRFAAQTYLPIAATGYTLDGVAENIPAASTTGGAMDASNFNLYSQFYGGLFSPAGVGLPNNGTIVNGTRTYQLQGYTGPNVFFVQPYVTDSMTFVTPQPYPSVSLLSFATQGSALINIKVRFTDNTSQVFSSISLADWFTANPSIYNGFDRVLRTTDALAYVASAGNPRMFGTDLAIACANQGKLISRVVIQNTGSAYVCVMAVSGSVPGYSVNSNVGICTSGTATLNATGFATYSWQPVGTFAGSNSATINVSPSATTTYTLLGTDASGCPGYTTTTVYVSGAVPVLSLTGSSQSVCLGAAATLSASGAVTYTWTNGVSNGVPFTPTTTLTYTVTGQNGCGSSTTVRTVSVAPIPVSLASTGTAVCTNKSATLTVTAAASAYTWQPQNSIGTSSNIAISPSVTTIYTVTASNGTCSGTNTISIQANPVPTIIASANTPSICPGNSAVLTASGGVSYTWTPVNQNTSTVSVSPTITTTYSLAGVNAFGCLNTTMISLAVGIKPILNVTANSSTICNGGSATLTASGANTYTWANGPFTSTSAVSPTQQTTYTVTGTNSSSGCTDVKTIDISVFSPSVAIQGNTTICEGAQTSFTASGANSYIWQPGGSPFSSISVSPSVSTVYTVNATTTSGVLSCPSSATVQVIVNAAPTLSATIKRTILCAKETNTLSVTGAATYTWSSVTGTATGASYTLTTNLTGVIIYTVTGTNTNNCVASTTLQMTVNKCTGIEELQRDPDKLNVYPNPGNGEFTITADHDLSLSLINELGQIIKQIQLSDDNAHKYLVTGMPEGIYFITGSRINLKIVVTK